MREKTSYEIREELANGPTETQETQEMKRPTVIDSILAAITELKEEAIYAKREAELNRKLALEYKEKYDNLVKNPPPKRG